MLPSWEVIFLHYRVSVCFWGWLRRLNIFHLFRHPHLKQVLVWQVVAGIDLEDEDMVDPGLSPPVRVDAQQEDELDQQEAAPVDPHQRPHVLEADEHSACEISVEWILW